jgi:hypothetical protein
LQKNKPFGPPANHPKPCTPNVVDSTGFQFKVYFSVCCSLSFFCSFFWLKSKEKIKNQTKKKNFSSKKTVKSQRTNTSSLNCEGGFKRNQADKELYGTVVTVNRVTKVT